MKNNFFIRHLTPMLVAAVVALSIGLSASSSAAACTWGGSGNCKPASFSGGTYNLDTVGYEVFDHGVYANDIASFIDDIRECLYSSTCGGQSHAGTNTGAAYIVLSMLPDTSEPFSVSAAQSKFAEWSNLVKSYDDANLVDYNYAPRNGWTHNTMAVSKTHSGGRYTGTTTDVIGWTPRDNITDAAGAITFFDPSHPTQVLYAIRRKCANPVFETPDGLEILNKWSLSASTQAPIPAGNNEVGQSIRFRHQLVNNGPLSTDQKISYETKVIRVAGSPSSTPDADSVYQAAVSHTMARDTYTQIARNQPAGSKLLKYADFDAGKNSKASISYNIVEQDSGNWICGYIIAKPSSDSNNDWVKSVPKCRYIALPRGAIACDLTSGVAFGASKTLSGSRSFSIGGVNTGGWDDSVDPPTYDPDLYNRQDTATAQLSGYWQGHGTRVIDTKSHSYWISDGYSGTLNPSGTVTLTEPTSPLVPNSGINYYYYVSYGSPSASDPASIHVQRHFCLTPNITIDPTDTSLITPSTEKIKVNATVTNTGPNKSYRTESWQITRFFVKPGGALQLSGSFSQPCSDFTGYISCAVAQSGWSGTNREFAVGNTTVKNDYNDLDIIGLRPGTQICYTMSVSQATWSSRNPTWVHAKPQCVTLKIIPSTNILGNDLIVGSTLATPTGNLSAKVSGMVFPKYGSWAEYGILASGTVDNFASQSGAINGGTATQSQWSALTFSNTAPNFGFFDSALGMGLQPNIAGYMKAAKDVGNKSIYYSKTANIEASDIPGIIGGADLDNFKTSAIIATTGNIYIDHDIKYTTGTLTSLNKIPQLVLIAKNIYIDDSVGNVDAWLIASGTVYTCRSATEIDDIAPDVCDKSLDINGPIEANRLFLARTYYNDRHPGDPAERIDLKGSTYLWSHRISENSGSWQTMYTTELPPRF